MLLLLAVMWTGAGIYYFRARPEGRSADSIGSFRHHLRVLERAGPATLNPTYRPRMIRREPLGPSLPARPTGLGAALSRTPSMAALRRQRAQKRRRDVVSGLVVATLGATALGFVPGLTAMWFLAGALVLALVLYVAVLLHLRGRSLQTVSGYMTRQESSNALAPAFVARRSGR